MDCRLQNDKLTKKMYLTVRDTDSQSMSSIMVNDSSCPCSFVAKSCTVLDYKETFRRISAHGLSWISFFFVFVSHVLHLLGQAPAMIMIGSLSLAQGVTRTPCGVQVQATIMARASSSKFCVPLLSKALCQCAGVPSLAGSDSESFSHWH